MLCFYSANSGKAFLVQTLYTTHFLHNTAEIEYFLVHYKYHKSQAEQKKKKNLQKFVKL